MDATMSVETLVKFAVVCVGAFAVIFLVAVLTPWMAKHVDNWIAHYRSTHSREHDVTYSVRSIYELPPRKQPDEPAKPETPESAPPPEDTQQES